MPVPQREIARHRAEQSRVAELVKDQLRALFASLNLNKPEDARNALLAAVPELVRQYGDMAATYAADAFDEWRRLERVGGRYTARVFDSPYLDAVEPLVRRSAGALWTDNPAALLVALNDKIGKYVLAAGRETMTRNSDLDPRASGWQRVVRAGGCGFCRMLSDRGAVYTESSVHFAAHGHCGCQAVPSWDQNAKPVGVIQYEASKRTSAMTPEQKAQHSERVRSWMRDNGYLDQPSN